jgi:hypothetical protein
MRYERTLADQAYRLVMAEQSRGADLRHCVSSKELINLAVQAHRLVNRREADLRHCVSLLTTVTQSCFHNIGNFCGDPSDAPRALEGEWGGSSEFIPFVGTMWKQLFEQSGCAE